MIMPGEGCFIAIILRSDPVKTKKTFIRTCYCLVKVKLITAERRALTGLRTLWIETVYSKILIYKHRQL